MIVKPYLLLISKTNRIPYWIMPKRIPRRITRHGTTNQEKKKRKNEKNTIPHGSNLVGPSGRRWARKEEIRLASLA